MAWKASTKSWRTGNRVAELSIVGLTAISIINVVFLWLFATRDPTTQVLGEVNELLPRFETKLIQFPFERHLNWDHATLRAMVNASMDAWINVLPKGGGFIAIDDFDKKAKEKITLHLPEAINTPDSDLRTGYGISVFHQLHCLHALHVAFNDAVSKKDSLKEFGRDRLEHTYHCFDYVKRALMCAADTALEGQSTGTEKPATKGEGSYHLCRDYDAVKEFAEAHRLTDMVVGG